MKKNKRNKGPGVQSGKQKPETKAHTLTQLETLNLFKESNERIKS